MYKDITKQREAQKKWRLKNQKKAYESTNEWRQSNPDKVKEYNRQWFSEHKESINERRKKWRIENKDRINEQLRLRLQNDIQFKLARNLRKRVIKALHGISKSKHTIELLGCSVDFLKTYLERQFTEGMNWSNYGVYGWHVDHIIPCDAFDLCKPEDQFKCFHYTNLQPLWAKDNLSKGANILTPLRTPNDSLSESKQHISS